MAYDGFEDGNYTANPTWDVVFTGGGVITVVEAAARFGSYGCRITSDGVNDAAYQGLRYRGFDEASGNYYAWVRTSHKDATGAMTFLIMDGVSEWIGIMGFNDGTITCTPNTGTLYSDLASNTWYRLRMYHDGADISFYVYDVNGDLLASQTGLTPNSAANINEVRFYNRDTENYVFTLDFDNVTYGDTDEPEPPPVGQYMVTKKYW